MNYRKAIALIDGTMPPKKLLKSINGFTWYASKNNLIIQLYWYIDKATAGLEMSTQIFKHMNQTKISILLIDDILNLGPNPSEIFASHDVSELTHKEIININED